MVVQCLLTSHHTHCLAPQNNPFSAICVAENVPLFKIKLPVCELGIFVLVLILTFEPSVSGGRRKRINPNNGINGPIKKLEIHCKVGRLEECRNISNMTFLSFENGHILNFLDEGGQYFKVY